MVEVIQTCVTAFLFVVILSLHGCASSHSTRHSQAPEIGNWVFVDGHLPDEAPYFLSPDILARLYPQLANPRVPSPKDIGDETDQWHFIAGGWAFVLFGDFNQDRLYDVAFVGKYDDVEIGLEQFFFSIFTVKGMSARVDYFTKLGHQRAVLKTFPRFYKKKYDAISRVYTFESCHCDDLFWNGSGYVAIPCSEQYESAEE